MDEFKRKYSEWMGGIGLMLLATFFFAFKPIFGRIAIENGLMPGPLVTLRLIVAVPLFLITIGFLRKWDEMKVAPKEFAILAATSGIGMAGAMIFSFYSIQYLGASISTLVIFVFPAITAVMSRFVYGEPITFLKRLSLIVSFAGISLVILPMQAVGGAEIAFFDPAKGLKYAFLCAFCWAGTQVSMQRLLKKIPPIVATSWSSVMVLCVFLAWYGAPSLDISPEAFKAVILLGTVCWYFPYIMVMYALKVIGASRSAIIQSIGPGMTVFVAWVLLGEKLELVQLLGMVLLIIAVYLIKNDGKKEAEGSASLQVAVAMAPESARKD